MVYFDHECVLVVTGLSGPHCESKVERIRSNMSQRVNRYGICG